MLPLPDHYIPHNPLSPSLLHFVLPIFKLKDLLSNIYIRQHTHIYITFFTTPDDDVDAPDSAPKLRGRRHTLPPEPASFPVEDQPTAAPAGYDILVSSYTITNKCTRPFGLLNMNFNCIYVATYRFT